MSEKSRVTSHDDDVVKFQFVFFRQRMRRVSKLLSVNWIYARWFDVVFVCVCVCRMVFINAFIWMNGWMGGWMDGMSTSGEWAIIDIDRHHQRHTKSISISLYTTHEPYPPMWMNRVSSGPTRGQHEPEMFIHRAHRAFVSCASFCVKIL